MPTAHRIAIVLMALTVCGISGCNTDPTVGYTTRDQYRQGIRTIYVPMWNRNKDVYRRKLEFRISEAVVKEIGASTRYRISEESRADTILTGEVVKVVRDVMAFNPDTGDPLEKEIIITFAFQWTDLRSGEVLAENAALEVTATYIPDLGTDFFQGSQDLVDKAARRVVEHMEAEW